MLKKQSFYLLFVLCMIVCLVENQAYAQEKSVRKYNVGISTGVGGIHFLMMPALELKLNRVYLRGSYGFFYHSYGIDIDCIRLPIPLAKQPLYLTASLLRNMQYKQLVFGEFGPDNRDDIYYAAAGLRCFNRKRHSLQIKGGIAYNRRSIDNSHSYPYTAGRSIRDEFFPFGELSLSFFFFFFKHQR